MYITVLWLAFILKFKDTKSRCKVQVLLLRKGRYTRLANFHFRQYDDGQWLSPLSLHADREGLSWSQLKGPVSTGGGNSVPFTVFNQGVVLTQDKSHFP